MGLKFFDNDELVIGGGDWELAPFRFSKILRIGGGVSPTWRDVVISGTMSLTLVNAKADGLNYLKLFGGTELLPETYLDSVTLDGKCEQNGTPTPTVPVDIVCNNGTIKVSPNLANMVADNITVGYYISAQGEVLQSDYNFIYNKFIPVKPNTTYTLSFSNALYFASIYEYSANDGTGFIQKTSFNSSRTEAPFDLTNCTITTGATTNYIRWSSNMYKLQVLTLDDVLAINWMLNQGNSMPYAPYSPTGIYTDGTVETVTDSNGLTATAQMLLSVGDYKDTQEVISGSVTRNVRIIVLDGTENWTKNGNLFYVDMATDALEDTHSCYCTHFKGIATNASASYDNEIKVGSNATQTAFWARVQIYPVVGTFSDVTALNQYLAEQYAQGTPVIVVYPISSATTETVTPQLLLKSPVTYSGSITGLTGVVTESQHTTPTPQQPLQINCNNGVLKVSPNLFTRAGETLNKFYDASGVEQNGVYANYSLAHTNFLKVKPNTTYTFGLKTSYKLTTDALNHRILGWSSSKVFVQQEGNIVQPTDVPVGTQLYDTFTTSATTEYITINFVYSPTETEIQLVQGSNLPATYIPYGQTYTDGTVETVEVTGKNLFDKSDVITGKILNDTGEVVNHTSGYYSGHITVQPSTEYTISQTNGLGIFLRVLEYDSTNTMIKLNKGTTNGTQTKTFTTDANTVYVIVSGSFNSDALDTIQLELGSTATTYEPYFNGGSATAERLLKVGTYQDVQSVLDGEVTRNVGIKVLDGTENWVAHGTLAGWFQSSESLVYGGIAPALCTHYPYNSYQGSAGVYFSTGRNNPQISRIIIADNVNFPNTGMVAEFKQFLANQYNSGNPVVIVYPLATATTETVTAQPLTIQAGTNIVEITQASMDNLELEVSYKAGVEVTVTEIENAQLDNSVEVTVNG